jgi:hypothetical protein
VDQKEVILVWIIEIVEDLNYLKQLVMNVVLVVKFLLNHQTINQFIVVIVLEVKKVLEVKEVLIITDEIDETDEIGETKE